ncbi:MAG: hypothetical protein RBS39_11280 [Phycisphaerales bacterium]|jgi:hypothetical protein|nr:hypothetical protein [Phycisphaerales bacterium]
MSMHAAESTAIALRARRVPRGLRSTAGLGQMAIAQAAALLDAARESNDATPGIGASRTLLEEAVAAVRDARDAHAELMVPMSGDALAPITPASASDERDEIRSEIGASRDETLIALLPGPDGSLDARWFGFVVGVLRLAHGSVRGVVSHGAWDLRRSHLLHRVARTSDPLIVTGTPIARFVGACDLAIVDPTGIMLGAPAAYSGASAAMIAGALAAGVPTAMHGHLGVEHVVPESVQGRCVLASRGASRVIEPLHALCADAGLRRTIGEQCANAWNAERLREHNRGFLGGFLVGRSAGEPRRGG